MLNPMLVQYKSCSVDICIDFLKNWIKDFTSDDPFSFMLRFTISEHNILRNGSTAHTCNEALQDDW